MILMILLALLCAAVLAYALHPIMRGSQRRTGTALLAGGALLSAGLYFALGAPDIPSAPAFYETAGPRYEQRLTSQRELVLLEALSGAPDHIPLLLELGTMRIQAGQPQDAFEVLNHANQLQPDDPRILEALGAAHYATALDYARQPRKDAQDMARNHFEKALSLTPKTAEYHDRLTHDAAAFSGGARAQP